MFKLRFDYNESLIVMSASRVFFIFFAIYVQEIFGYFILTILILFMCSLGFVCWSIFECCKERFTIAASKFTNRILQKIEHLVKENIYRSGIKALCIFSKAHRICSTNEKVAKNVYVWVFVCYTCEYHVSVPKFLHMPSH